MEGSDEPPGLENPQVDIDLLVGNARMVVSRDEWVGLPAEDIEEVTKWRKAERDKHHRIRNHCADEVKDQDLDIWIAHYAPLGKRLRAQYAVIDALE